MLLCVLRPRPASATLQTAARLNAESLLARASRVAVPPAHRRRAAANWGRGGSLMAASASRSVEATPDGGEGDKITANPAERNKEAILAVLREYLGTARGLFLEVASGTGQHVAHFAAALPALQFQPSERDPVGPNMQGATMASIIAWTKDLPNVRPPLQLDVMQPPEDWGVPEGSCTAVFGANMCHVSPWGVTAGLVAGAGRALQTGGLLLMYGPFSVDGRPTTESNAEFDARLRERGPGWGYKDVGQVTAECDKAGLALVERRPMPADNFTLVFRKQ